MTRFVPDELSLTMWGASGAPSSADVVIANPLPAELVGPWHALRDDLSGAVISTVASPLPAAAQPAPAHEHHEAHDHDHHHDGGHDHDHHHDGGHDHGDMMAVTGEPSADGLVMEPIELQHGPLAPGLPGGLVLEVELDGDVVSRCDPKATLLAHDGVPDPLTPAAWRAAARDDATWLEVAATERERALSHAAWLRGLARVLGWSGLAERVDAVVRAVAETGEDALPVVDGLVGDLLEDRRLRARLSGYGRMDADRAPGLQGPNARAAGRPRDARAQDPRYATIGFEPVLETEGDALARTRVRLREMAAALRLAAAAERQDAPAPAQPSSAAVESARGPVLISGTTAVAPGAAAALAAAGRAAVGLEWSSALAVIVSFDLSPWQVTG